MDPLAVLDVRAALDGHDVPEADPEVVPDDAVHADLVVRDGVVRQHDAHALLPLLALEEDSVAAEQLNINVILIINRTFQIPELSTNNKYSKVSKCPEKAFRIELIGHLKTQMDMT